MQGVELVNRLVQDVPETTIGMNYAAWEMVASLTTMHRRQPPHDRRPSYPAARPMGVILK